MAAAPLNPVELKRILAEAMQIPNLGERQAFVKAAMARVISNLNEWRAKQQGAQLSAAKLKDIQEEALQIPDLNERKAFVSAALKGVMADLAQWRKMHPNDGWIKKLGKGIRVVGSAIKKGVAWGVSLVGNVALLPLVPFIPAMKKEVKKTGRKPSSNLKTLATQFQSAVLSKSSYDIYSIYKKDSYEHHAKDNLVGALSVGNLVKVIVKYFNKIKGKKERGEPMSKQETEILKVVEQAEAEVEQVVLEEAEQGIGAWVIKNRTPIIITTLSATALIIGLIGYSRAKGKA